MTLHPICPPCSHNWLALQQNRTNSFHISVQMSPCSKSIYTWKCPCGSERLYHQNTHEMYQIGGCWWFFSVLGPRSSCTAANRRIRVADRSLGRSAAGRAVCQGTREGRLFVKKRSRTETYLPRSLFQHVLPCNRHRHAGGRGFRSVLAGEKLNETTTRPSAPLCITAHHLEQRMRHRPASSAKH